MEVLYCVLTVVIGNIFFKIAHHWWTQLAVYWRLQYLPRPVKLRWTDYIGSPSSAQCMLHPGAKWPISSITVFPFKYNYCISRVLGHSQSHSSIKWECQVTCRFLFVCSFVCLTTLKIYFLLMDISVRSWLYKKQTNKRYLTNASINTVALTKFNL